ncbi:MAG: molybdenum ABC transporter ATP-binding protein [Pseudomonadota bacterium]
MTLEVALRHRIGAFTLDAAFQAPPGVTALFGRSGAGKSSVVQAVAGLMRPREGAITLEGETLLDTAAGVWRPPHRRRLGVVFQESRLFAHMSVRRNLLYGARFSGGAARGALADVVDLLGLGGLLSRSPATLSGGEQQRVAIGRALLARPRMLVMDEPLAALDAPRRAEILPYLERLRDSTGLPILYVSHSVAEVARLAATLVVMEAGRVAHAGPAAELLADPAIAPLIGVREAGALLSARVVAHAADGLTELAVSAGRLVVPRIAAPPGARLRVRVPATDVILATATPRGLSALNILPVRVAGLRPGSGPGVIVQLRAGDELLLARITRRSAEHLGLAPGLACHAIIKSVSVAPGNIGGPTTDAGDIAGSAELA